MAQMFMQAAPTCNLLMAASTLNQSHTWYYALQVVSLTLTCINPTFAVSKLKAPVSSVYASLLCLEHQQGFMRDQYSLCLPRELSDRLYIYRFFAFPYGKASPHLDWP